MPESLCIRVISLKQGLVFITCSLIPRVLSNVSPIACYCMQNLRSSIFMGASQITPTILLIACCYPHSILLKKDINDEKILQANVNEKSHTKEVSIPSW